MNDIRDSLLEKLQNISDLKDFRITCLPDFTLDCLVTLDSWEETISKIKEVRDRGGGLLREYPLTLTQGGNATNTASALSSLGVKTHLIGRTSELGLKLAQHFLSIP
ncbi:MAG: hypothetical protein KGY45_04330, partial [Hadesarchaea archaeon]|nr:hypothetical protein [Hadesarchaea archaeon]